MKKILGKRIGLFISTYFIFVLLFIVFKLVFLLFHYNQSCVFGLRGWVDVICAGLPMDLSVAGYASAIPALILLASVFGGKHLKKALNIYFILSSIVIALIFVPDVELYSYWGFRIDSTVFTYITSPAEAMLSAPVYAVLLSIVCVFLLALAQYLIFRKAIVSRFPTRVSSQKPRTSIAIIVLMGLMFVCIRGGVTTSTMNPSRVYFSSDMFLNHAAINPVFNLIYSIDLKENFDKQYRFMDNKQAENLLAQLMADDGNAQTPKLLNTDRPNIVFVLLESFGAAILESLGGAKGVAPNMNKLCEEGVLFSNLYANSFRTDRGIVSALAGFPAQPTMSILKHAKKVQKLNSLPKSLVENGYKASFMYGGDVNFAQMKTLFVTQKVTDITTDTDFPLDLRISKWGVPDAYTFDKLSNDLSQETQTPFLKIFLTLSSHEPFDVPTNKFDDPYLNSIHYTDSCIGVFIDKLKASPQWENTLVVFIPDHNMRYPKTIGHHDPARHHSFMLWLGGAVKQPQLIERVCSQTDVAATILGQLNIDYKDKFSFSKNILNPSTREFAFYTFPNGFGMISDKGKAVYDCDGKKTLLEEGTNIDSLLLQGKAVLQSLYNEIGSK